MRLKKKKSMTYGTSIFSFLRPLHIVLQGGFINLHSQQCKRVAFPLQPLPHLFFVDFFDHGHSDPVITLHGVDSENNNSKRHMHLFIVAVYNSQDVEAA